MVKLSFRTSVFIFVVLLLDIVITIESKRDLDNALNLQHLLNYDNRRRSKFHQHYSFPNYNSMSLREKRSPRRTNRLREIKTIFKFKNTPTSPNVIDNGSFEDLFSSTQSNNPDPKYPDGTQITDNRNFCDNLPISTPMEVSLNLNQDSDPITKDPQKIDEDQGEDNPRNNKEDAMLDYLFNSRVNRSSVRMKKNIDKGETIVPQARKTLADLKGPEIMDSLDGVSNWKLVGKPHVRVKRNKMYEDDDGNSEDLGNSMVMGKNNDFMQIIKSLKNDLEKSRRDVQSINKLDGNEADEDEMELVDSESKKLRTSSNLKDEIGKLKCNLNDVYADILNAPVEPMSPTIRLVRTKRTRCCKKSHNETNKSTTLEKLKNKFSSNTGLNSTTSQRDKNPPNEFFIIETSDPLSNQKSLNNEQILHSNEPTKNELTKETKEQSRRRRGFLFSKKKSKQKNSKNKKTHKKNKKRIQKNQDLEQLPKEIKIGDSNLEKLIDSKKRQVHQTVRKLTNLEANNNFRHDQLKRNERLVPKKQNCDNEPLEAFIDPDFDKAGGELYNSGNNDQDKMPLSQMDLSQKKKRNNRFNSKLEQSFLWERNPVQYKSSISNTDKDEQSEQSKSNINDEKSETMKNDAVPQDESLTSNDRIHVHENTNGEKEILINDKMKSRIKRNQRKLIESNYRINNDESKYDSHERENNDEGAEKSVREVKNLVDKLLLKVDELRDYMGNEKIVARDKKAIYNSKSGLFNSKPPPHENESPKLVQQCVHLLNVTIPPRIIEDAVIAANANDLEQRDLEMEGDSKNKESNAKDGILSPSLSKSNTIKRLRAKRKPDRKWDKWTDWSSCSVTCGKGRQIRWRHCLKDCTNAESEMEQKNCQLPACPPNKFLGIF